jgi:hypothetical protein
MSELLELCADGGNDTRVVVADVEHANARRKIQVFPSVDIPHASAFAARGEQRMRGDNPSRHRFVAGSQQILCVIL